MQEMKTFKPKRNCLYEEIHRKPPEFTDGVAKIYFEISYHDWCELKESQLRADLLQYLDSLQQRNKMQNHMKEYK